MPSDERFRFCATQVEGAEFPEDFFGDLPGIGDSERERLVKEKYKAFAKVLHPDHNANSDESSLMFQKLEKLYEGGLKALSSGAWGMRRPFGDLKITTRLTTYTIGGPIAAGDVSDLFSAEDTSKTSSAQDAICAKICRDPKNNDLLDAEYETLKLLQGDKDNEGIQRFVSQLVESFQFKDDKHIKRNVNILKVLGPGWYNLEQVLAKYPKGIDAKDVAWIWRRVLIGLNLPHASKRVHGALIPSNIMVSPEGHDVCLVDWCYSVQQGDPLVAIVGKYKDLYPPELMDQEPTNVGTDIYTAAATMTRLLQADAPKPFRGFFKGCMLNKPTARPQDARALFVEFTDLMDRVYPKREFHKFSMV